MLCFIQIGMWAYSETLPLGGICQLAVGEVKVPDWSSLQCCQQCCQLWPHHLQLQIFQRRQALQSCAQVQLLDRAELPLRKINAECTKAAWQSVAPGDAVAF